MSNKVTQPDIDASGIYEGGSISQITADELTDNIVAIRQLINSHNLVANESKNKDVQIQSIKSQMEYLRTSPFMSIVTAIVNIIGTICIGIGAKLITETNPPWHSKALIILGGALVLLGSLANILYPKARDWFNPSKEN